MNKRYCLKKNYDIEKLVKVKKSVGTKNFAIYYVSKEDIKIAYAVNKKYGCAVERNKAKRIAREIIRLKFHLLPKVHMLIVIKPSSINLSYLEKDKEFEYMIKKMKNNIKGEQNEKRTK